MDIRSGLGADTAPTPGSESTESSTGAIDYVVVRGDTLWSIATNHLGAGARWPEIHQANRDTIRDPNLIYPGMSLRIPVSSPDSEVMAGGPLDPAVCGEPEFPYVIVHQGEALTASDVDAARLQLEAVFAEWGQPSFDGSWLSLHTFYEGLTAVVLAWSGDWGAVPSNANLTSSLEPLHARLAVVSVRATEGWATLDAATRARLEVLLGGETNPLSQTARNAFKSRLTDGTWASTSAVDQGTFLNGLIDANTNARQRVTSPLGDISPEPHTLSSATFVPNHQFVGVQADADRYTVTVGQQSTTIWAPHAPDATAGIFHSVEEAAVSFAALPFASRAVINNITLNAAQNPADAFWAVEYNTPGFRSYMTAGAAGDVTIYPQTTQQSQEVMATSMIHETGHTWSFQNWGSDTTQASWAPWRAAMASDRISVSNYATNSVSEDFAESLRIYQDSQGRPAHDEYRAMIPARFGILDTHFGGGNP